MENIVNELRGKRILITGATGLIGSNIIGLCTKVNNTPGDPIHIVAQVRNLEKAQMLFGTNTNLEYAIGNIVDDIQISSDVDYIIHCASQTSSKMFIEEPVETIETAVNGTKNILEFAKKKNVKSIVYLSTMEVYGAPTTEEKIYENHETNINTMEVRSSYPESKRLCEALCCAYCAEYGLPVKVLRLTQTFGMGVSYNDTRVFAEFARCVIENKDIILHTKGETKRSYLDVEDAVNAIVTVLLKGENGQAYNAANENTFCSIYEMAQMVVKECANGKICVKIETRDENEFGFAPTLKMNLDTSKLQALGWKAEVDLLSMFRKLIQDMSNKIID